MLKFAARPPRQSFEEGPSTVFCVAVTACTVVMSPFVIVYLSWMTFASGARQLVVHDALETTSIFDSYLRAIGHVAHEGSGKCIRALLEVHAAHEHGRVLGGRGDYHLREGAPTQPAR